MSWASQQDRMVRRVRDRFAHSTSIAYTCAGHAADSISAIFNEAHEVQEMRDGIPVNTTRPTLFVRIADLAATPVAGDTCVIDSVSYDVTDVQPDGSGMAACFLARA
jgi:hypothetical protein